MTRSSLRSLALGSALSLVAACSGPAPETEAEAQPTTAAAQTPVTPVANGEATEVTVYKTPTCGCCTLWADHMRANGFQVTVIDQGDLTDVKRRLGVSDDLSSCHTATVGGYVVEGHVPAGDVRRLLAERPEVVGISAPGMPMGSPGMEGSRKEAYDVVSFDRAGNRQVFASH